MLSLLRRKNFVIVGKVRMPRSLRNLLLMILNLFRVHQSVSQWVVQLVSMIVYIMLFQAGKVEVLHLGIAMII
jgi:hypothetical protein